MYQRLEGGSGRDVFFRAPRLNAQWLSGKTRLTVRFGRSVGTLKNVSLGGLLVELQSESVGPHADVETPLELCIDDTVVYRGTGVAVREQQSGRGAQYGVKLLADLVEPRELRRRVRDAVFERAARAGTSTFEYVPPKYRTAIADAVLTLGHWRELLDLRQRELADSSDISNRNATERLEEIAEEGLRLDWRRVRQQAIEASSEIPEASEAFWASKRLTESVLTPLLACAPIWSHAYHKPRGYPGDFELMNYMYESNREGDSLFARSVHQLGREERLAATVRDRRRFLAEAIQQKGLRCASSRQEVFRVANLGSGPARELEDLLRNWRGGLRLVLTLIDQDADALEYADRRLRQIAAEFGSNIEIRCRFISFRQLFRDPTVIRELVEHDVIYSAGFFDYLRDEVAQPLLASLFSLLRCGGRLLVGNAVDAADVKWVPEFVLDWQLIYRSPDEMRRLCKYIEGPHRLGVSFDTSGAWQFLEVEKG